MVVDWICDHMALAMIPPFFSRKIFATNLIIAVFYTAGGLFAFGLAIYEGKLTRAMCANQVITMLWVGYIVVMTSLPYTYKLKI